jgi:hypothetical protein
MDQRSSSRSSLVSSPAAVLRASFDLERARTPVCLALTARHPLPALRGNPSASHGIQHIDRPSHRGFPRHAGEELE